MPDPEVTNWFGDLVSHPKVIVEANSKEDIIAVLKNPAKYPSPVRAVGSNHSTALCGAADGGTLIKMKMNRILNIGPDTVTVEAGAVHLDIARELEKKQLQFYVNTEIGSLSAGSAACAGTKDASMPGEYGQVGSYVTGVKMVLPTGDLLEVTEDQPELMKKIRSSYGTFGIVYEVTFRIRQLVPMAVHHKTYRIKEFLDALPELKALNYSIMYYVFPFTDYITVEFRKYNPGAKGEPDHHIGSSAIISGPFPAPNSPTISTRKFRIPPSASRPSTISAPSGVSSSKTWSAPTIPSPPTRSFTTPRNRTTAATPSACLPSPRSASQPSSPNTFNSTSITTKTRATAPTC